MEESRFELFAGLLNSAVKSIQRLKAAGMKQFNLSAAHTTCLCRLAEAGEDGDLHGGAPFSLRGKKGGPEGRPSRRVYSAVIYLSTMPWKVPSAFSSAMAALTASSRAVFPLARPMA